MSWDKEHGFSIQKLRLKDDYEGKVEATLIERKAKTKSQKHHLIKLYFTYMDSLIISSKTT